MAKAKKSVNKHKRTARKTAESKKNLKKLIDPMALTVLILIFFIISLNVFFFLQSESRKIDVITTEKQSISARFYQDRNEILKPSKGIFDVELSLNKDYSFNFENTDIETLKKLVIFEIKPENIDTETYKYIPGPTPETQKAFLIDPSFVEFENAEYTSTAKGNRLLKCKIWDEENNKCISNWIIVQKLIPGEEYSVKLDKEDPVFVEATYFELFEQTESTFQSQTTNFTTSTTWTVPAGVTNIFVEAWGGGGSGTGSSTTVGGFGAGGGGAFASANISVTSGENLTLSVAVSVAGTNTETGNNGTPTYLQWQNGTTAVYADYGRGAVGGTGGAGGQATNSIGTVKYSGGRGADGNNKGSGGGGGAGNMSIGSDGNLETGGAGGLELGGKGGDGVVNLNAYPGENYGGGGGGVRRTNGARSGGAGAQGFIRITYDMSTDTLAPRWSNQMQNVSIIKPGESVKLMTYWEDDYGLDTAILSTNETGVWENKTTYGSPLSLSGNSSWSNFTWQNPSILDGTIVAWKIYANDTSNNWNVSQIKTFKINKPLVPPLISLIFPYDNESDSNGFVKFIFNVSGENQIMNCSLYINGSMNLSKTKEVGEEQEQYITMNDLPEDNFTWKIKCVDEFGTEGSSEERTINILRAGNLGFSKIYSKVLNFYDEEKSLGEFKLIDALNEIEDYDITENETAVIEKGVYKIRIVPKNSFVKEILIKDVLIGYDELKYFLKLDENISSSLAGEVQSFAIKTNQNISFQNKTINLTSQGNELFKCAEWDFENRQCNGQWVKMMSIIPGKNYTIIMGFEEEVAYSEIIKITNAMHLDSERNFIEDVYDLVKERDYIYALIPSGDYLRVFFEKNLTSENDITIYARSNNSGSVEVYEKDSDIKIADFGVISDDKKYQIFLTELEQEQDAFDLKVVEGDVEFDFVIDPTPICNLISTDPTEIFDNATGFWNILMNCSVSNGINLTPSMGFGIAPAHFNAFITRTVDNGIIDFGVPNHFINFYPNNSLSTTGHPNLPDPKYKIWRGQARNIGAWYDNLEYYDTLNNDTFSYSVNDGRLGGLKITNLTGTYENATSILFNYTGLVQIDIFRSSYYLCQITQWNNPKYNLELTNNVNALARRFDAEAYRSIDNYTIYIYINLHNSGSTARVLRTFYCNDSYNPSGSVKPIDSSFCGLIDTINSDDVKNKLFERANSSYIEEMIGVTNGLKNGIKTTAEYYLAFDVSGVVGSVGNRFNIRYLNGSSQVAMDIDFSETNVSWTSTNSGTTWLLQPFTFDIMSSSVIRQGNEIVEYGIYINDSKGQSYFNEKIWREFIVETTLSISHPTILKYNSSATLEDCDRNGTHSGMMNIKIGMASQPGKPGNVNHSLYLMNTDGSLNYTINESFYSPNDEDIWIDFNTSLVSDGFYKMNVTARGLDNPNDIQSFLTGDNLTIDNTPPQWTGQSQNTSTPGEGKSVLLSAYWEDNFKLSHAILSTNETGVWENKTTYGSPLSLSGNSSWSNFTWQNPSILDGTIVAWKIYANDTANNWNVTGIMNFTIYNPPPTIQNFTYYPDPSIFGQETNFTANITDDNGVKNATISVYDGTAYTNYTMNYSASDKLFYFVLANNTEFYAGTYNITIYAYDILNKSAEPYKTNFTIAPYISISLTKYPLNFTNVEAGQVSQAQTDNGWPLEIQNTGNTYVNITLSGQNMTGQTFIDDIIPVTSIYWQNTTNFATNNTLTESPALLVSNLPKNTTYNIYFKLVAPLNIRSQTYTGNVSFNSVQS